MKRAQKSSIRLHSAGVLLLCVFYIFSIMLCYQASIPLKIGAGSLSDHVHLAWLTDALPWSIACSLSVLIPWLARKWRMSIRFHIVLVILASSMCLWLTSRPVSYSMDIYRYLWDGRLLLHGQNPFQHVPSDPHYNVLKQWSYWRLMGWKAMPEAYPPMAQLLFALLSFLSTGVVIAYKHWLIANWLLSAGLFYVLLVLRKTSYSLGAAWRFTPKNCINLLQTHRLVGRDRILFECFLLCPPLLVEGYGAGHVDVLTIPFILLAWMSVLRNRFGWFGLWIAIATSIKVFPALFLVAFWDLRRPRQIAKSLLIFISVSAVLFVPFLSAGTNLFAYYHHVASIAYNDSLCYWLERLFGSAIYDHSTIVTFSCLIAACSVFMFSKARHMSPEVKCCLLGLTFILSSPLVHPWYVLALLPFAITAFEWSTLMFAMLSHFTYDELWMDLYTEYIPTYVLYFLSFWRGWRNHRLAKKEGCPCSS